MRSPCGVFAEKSTSDGRNTRFSSSDHRVFLLSVVLLVVTVGSRWSARLLQGEGAGSEVSWKGGRVVDFCLVTCEAIL